MTNPLIFDGHNDSLLRLYQHCEGDPVGFLEDAGSAAGRGRGQLDLPRALSGGFGGGFFAVFVPPPRDLDPEDLTQSTPPAGYDEPVPQGTAARVALEMIAGYHRLVAASCGRVRPLTSRADLRLEEDSLLALLHLEGAEPVDERLANLEAFHALGVRSIGPVWSRSNAFGHGVPFRFPSSPDTGEGLTAAGRELVRACRDLGMVVDLAHLNEKGFWDAAELGGGPLVSTHTCCHALSPSSRNLTDDQLRAVRDSDGVVGLNFHVGDLRAKGPVRRQIPLTRMVEHLDHMVEIMGLRHVALGSDFDGALMPEELTDASQLPRLVAALSHAGWETEAIAAVTHGNWLRLLDATLLE